MSESTTVDPTQPAIDPNAPAAAPAAEAPAEASAEDKPHKTPGDLARDEIYAKAQARRAEAGDASEQAMRAGVASMLNEPEAAPAASEKPASPPLAQNPEMVTLTVDGREIQVPSADVWKHGVATLQKQTAADIRLQRAAQAERQIALEREALDRRAAEIAAAQRLPAQADAASSEDATDLPKGGSKGGRAGTKQVLDALLDSDTETAAKALDRVVAERVEATMKARGASPAATPSTTVRDIPDPWSKAQKDAANDVFATVFPQILHNPVELAKASARMQAEMANPVNRMGKVDLAVLATRIGAEQVRYMAPATPAATPPESNADALAARRSLAARVPVVPGTPSARSALNAPAAAAVPTRAEIVQQMRKSRGM